MKTVTFKTNLTNKRLIYTLRTFVNNFNKKYNKESITISKIDLILHNNQEFKLLENFTFETIDQYQIITFQKLVLKEYNKIKLENPEINFPEQSAYIMFFFN
uniref:hypothetical protein n=1 Tax=Pallidohirschioporus biformis TaxID=50381 RepID=UPI002E76F853|nr:hypothetical protein V2724_mgp24 [Pallidohirschioporus biformis]WQA11108.1 hypothetical protein [Pallidohirschioporus biformis]